MNRAMRDQAEQIALIEEQLARLEALRQVLGDALTDQKQTELRAQLTDISGGVTISGTTKVGGDVVGRDKTTYAATAERATVIAGSTSGVTLINSEGNTIVVPPDRLEPDILLQAYYRSLAAECSRLPLGLIDKEFVHTSGDQIIALPDVYVDLDVITPMRRPEALERGWTGPLSRSANEERAPLLDMLCTADNVCAVLLGDAGSGKTTFVNYLTYLLGTNPITLPEPLRELLPVRLILREAAARHIAPNIDKGTAQMLWDALRDDIAARLGAAAADRLLPHLQGRLLKEGGFIMLDGLDEVPQAQQRRKALLEAIQELAELLPRKHSRILVTARPYAYADPRWKLGGFSILALAAFNDKQVGHFIMSWYQAVRPSMGWSGDIAYEKSKRLHAILKERPYLADLATRPLLLTLMTTLHSSWGQLPEDRADLYEETVKLLLSRWQRAREVKGPGGEPVVEPGITQTLRAGEERIRAALETLAFTVHARQRKEQSHDDQPADISEGEVLVAFRPLLRNLDPDELLHYLKDRAGIIIARREGVYTFPHRSFQEYLAACYLANQPQFAEQMQLLISEDPLWWQEVFLLGVGKAKQGGLSSAVALISFMMPENPEDINGAINEQQLRAAALAAQALIELRLTDKTDRHPHYEAIIKRARRWLLKIVEEGLLPARERANVGDILAKLGDPRFDPGFLFLPRQYRNEPEPFWGFVEVPAGPFAMGSHRRTAETNADELGNPRKLAIPYTYWIARYPVTVAQFWTFINAGAYEDQSYWTEDGWAWRKGEWDQRIQDHALLDWLNRRPRELRDAPMLWDQQYRDFNRPVIGVSWFEASAYSKWLDTQLRASVSGGKRAMIVPDDYVLPYGYVVRMPTEAEWEKAARPQGDQHYPWGDDAWNEERANIGESRVGHPTPVGIYPRGATPNGLHDLSGNVWEWTISGYEPYPYRPNSTRQNDRADHAYTLRGGSWLTHYKYARSSSRRRSIPGGLDHDAGFRLVVSIASFEF
jgi:formylglycine-generating enzyme required for sulfatase activity